MMLISEAGGAQSVSFGTQDNTPPIDGHGHVDLSDLFEGRIKISVSGTDLNAVLKVLVRAAVIDRNDVAALKVRRDFVDPVERGLIERGVVTRRFGSRRSLKKRTLDEDKLFAVQTYEFLPSIVDQAHRHRV